MAETALDLVSNFENITTSPTLPINRTRNIAYLCNNVATDSTAPIIEITDPAQISIYTEDARIEKIFNYGISKVYLIFNNLDDVEIMKEGLIEASLRAFSLIISPDILIVNANLELDIVFDGVKFWQKESLELLLEETPRISDNFANHLTIQAKDDSLSAEICADFVQEGNSLWAGRAYAEFPDFSPTITTPNNAKIARNLFLSFIYKDETTITIPSLFYSYAGKLPLAEYYIAEEIKEKIQLTTFNIIKENNKDGKNFKYLDSNINILISAGQKVIDSYIDRGIIEAGIYTIPYKALQIPINKNEGLLAGQKIELTQAADIWFAEGTINTKSGLISTLKFSTQKTEKNKKLDKIEKNKSLDKKLDKTEKTPDLSQKTGKAEAKNIQNNGGSDG